MNPRTMLAGGGPLLGGLALFLAILPIFVLPPMVDSFVLSKVVAVSTAAVVFVTLCIIDAVKGRPFRIALDPINGFLAVFVLWNAISAAWSDAPWMTLSEVTRLSATFLLVLCIRSVCGNVRGRLMVLAKGLLAASLMVSLLVIVKDFQQAFAPGSIRVMATLGDWRDAISSVALGNTSHLGDLLAVGFLGWLVVFIAARRLVTLITSSVALWLHAAALIVCWSVHSNLSLIVGAGLFLTLLWRGGWLGTLLRRRGRMAAIIAGWLVVVAFYVVDHPLNPHGSAVWAGGKQTGGIFDQAFSSQRWKEGGVTRVAIWLGTLQVIKENPWLGVGGGAFTWAYPAAISPLVLNDPELAGYAGSWTNAAHNEVLQVWSELGVGGVFLLIVIIALPLKSVWERVGGRASFGNALLLAATGGIIAAMAIQMQMNFPLRLPVSTLLWMIAVVVPFMIPESAMEDRPLMVPVERSYGPFRLGVMMRNMAYPSEVSLRGDDLAPSMRIAVACILAGVAGLLLWRCTLPIRADIRYRDYREQALSSPTRRPLNPTAGLAIADDVLSLWPGHVDCRSAAQDLALADQKYDRVIAQTPLVLQRLNAIEVRLRRAIALETLGRTREADPDWAEVFRRQPRYKVSYPEAAARFNAARMTEAPVP